MPDNYKCLLIQDVHFLLQVAADKPSRFELDGGLNFTCQWQIFGVANKKWFTARQEVGCWVYEGQPQREHQRCPTQPDSVSSAGYVWCYASKVTYYDNGDNLDHVNWSGTFTNAPEQLSRSRARSMPSPLTPAKRFPNLHDIASIKYLDCWYNEVVLIHACRNDRVFNCEWLVLLN